MIKTLRITSIIVAIAAVVLLLLPVIYGVRKDPKIDEFLKKPGVVEKFTAAGGQNNAKNDIQNSPLVKQAKDLGIYFNPPPPLPPKAQPGAATQANQPPAPPVPPAVKFDIVATSYSASNPQKSFVLIDEVGKGLHWVSQGSTLGHVTIETVKDGAIVVRDGTRTFEMTVKVKETWRSLLKNPPPVTRAISTSPSPASASPAVQVPAVSQDAGNTNSPTQAGAARQAPPNMPTRRALRPGITPAANQRITSALPSADNPTQPAQAANVEVPAPAVQVPPPAQISKPPEQATNSATPVVELTPEKQAEMDKLISDVAAGKVTGDEAAQMEKLVEAMKKMENDPQSQPEAGSEPNAPAGEKQ